VIALLRDDSYAEFQRFLAKQPDAGDVIQLGAGRREPTGPAKALLTAVSKGPTHVLKALAGACNTPT
jgi:hypothetical protein